MIGAGDRVACVRADFHPIASSIFNELPRKGQVYVVRDAYEHPQGNGILLVGIYGPIHPEIGLEHGFHAERFRKLCTDPGKKKETSTAKE